MQEIFAQILLFLRGAWRYRWPALALTWLICLVGWAVVAMIPDEFEARTQVYVDTESLLKPLLEDIAVQRDVMSQVAMVQAVMLSRPNLEKVARANDLFLNAPTPLQQEKIIDDLADRVVLTSSAPRLARPRADQGGTFSVAFADNNPVVAHGVVQSLLDTFMEDSLGMKRTDSGVAQRFLQSQLSEYERKLVEAEGRLADFKKFNVGLLPGAEGDYYNRLESSIAQADQLNARYRQVSERRNELQRQLDGEEPTFGLTGPVGGDPIDAQIASYQVRIDQLKLQYTDKHPEIVAIRDTIARLEAEKAEGLRISSSVAPPASGSPSEEALARSLDMNPVYQNLRIALSQADAELAELRGQRDAQNQAVANLRGKVDAIPEVEAELLRLTRDYEVNKKQYDELLQRLESARISEQADQNTEDVKFRVIEPPVVPLAPSGPERPLLSALVLLLGLGAGLALGFVLQQVRPVFSTRDALRQVTGLPVIGAVTSAVVQGFVPWYRRQSALAGGALLALLAVFLLNVLLQDNVRAALRSLVG
ncbi:MAG: chain length-determining protein [Lysobacterales bacterium]|jgi:polysaccharide chain length determinant protein (PEP-CTERM system associated)|nr:MAG: chain length-determining protein [Xanthomonadales bacterium]